MKQNKTPILFIDNSIWIFLEFMNQTAEIQDMTPSVRYQVPFTPALVHTRESLVTAQTLPVAPTEIYFKTPLVGQKVIVWQALFSPAGQVHT